MVNRSVQRDSIVYASGTEDVKTCPVCKSKVEASYEKTRDVLGNSGMSKMFFCLTCRRKI